MEEDYDGDFEFERRDLREPRTDEEEEDILEYDRR
jgi:hypothetical protein